MTLNRVSAAVLAAVAAAAPAARGVVYFDGVFNNPDWTLTTVTNFSSGASTVQGFQVLTGGNPNEYRRVNNNLVAPNGSGAVWGVHMNVNAFYNPGSSGAISYIDYSEDSLNLINQPGHGQSTGIVILQGGDYFLQATPFMVMPYASFSTWGPNAAPGLVATDFQRLDPLGYYTAATPDFSSSGGVMQFGFWRANSGNNSYNTACGIDNWRVEVVPAPGAAAMLGLGGLAALRRRR